MQSSKPLQYPSHFPPTDKWKRFFIGVRWLGPDLSFFEDLRSTQGSRSLESMNVWGDGERHALASAVGSIFSKHCNWPTPYFLPGDKVSVIAGGCKFGWLDDTDVHEAVGAIEEIIGVKMASTFWKASGAKTFGQLVDQLLAAAGPDNSFKPKPFRGAA